MNIIILLLTFMTFGQPNINEYADIDKGELIINKTYNKIKIYNLIGNMVLKKECSEGSIDISKLTSGMYIVYIYGSNGVNKIQFYKN